MNQLVLQIKGQPSLNRIDITPQEEEKLQKLIDERRLPAVFTLKGIRVVSDTILGFYDKLSPDENPFDKERLPIQQDFFANVRSQSWYQRGQKAKEARKARMGSLHYF